MFCCVFFLITRIASFLSWFLLWPTHHSVMYSLVCITSLCASHRLHQECALTTDSFAVFLSSVVLWPNMLYRVISNLLNLLRFVLYLFQRCLYELGSGMSIFLMFGFQRHLLGPRDAQCCPNSDASICMASLLKKVGYWNRLLSWS